MQLVKRSLRCTSTPARSSFSTNRHTQCPPSTAHHMYSLAAQVRSACFSGCGAAGQHNHVLVRCAVMVGVWLWAVSSAASRVVARHGGARVLRVAVVTVATSRMAVVVVLVALGRRHCSHGSHA